MKYYHMSECLIWTPEGAEDKPVEICFFINVRDSRLPTGRWKLKVYIDGGFIFEDSFLIKPIVYAPRNGYSLQA